MQKNYFKTGSICFRIYKLVPSESGEWSQDAMQADGVILFGGYAWLVLKF